MSLADPEGIAARLLRSGWLLLVASGAVFVLLILVSVSWRNNRFDLQAVSGLVEVTASTRATHTIGVKLAEGAEFRLFGTHLQNRPPELAQAGDPYNGIRLTADSVVLESVVLDPDTILTLTSTTDGSPDLRIMVGGAIKLTLSGTIRQIADNGVARQIAVTERPFGLDATPSGTVVPVRLVLPAAGELKGIALYDQPIHRLDFTRPRPTNEDQRLPFQSELLSGKLKLLDTGDELPLQPRELIWLKEVAATAGRLEFGADGVAINASGHALSIGIGPPRPGSPPLPDRDVTPSVLAYLLGQHELKLAWGAALAVLAALWKARQWAFKWGR
ncbi:MAG TPA: hypothetical protein VKM93_16820 [Terriglobia bacterium]|nr:hypothetical protein [Terriglobia bacterium]